MKQLGIVLLVASLAGCHVFAKTKPHYAALPVDSLREVALEIEKAIQDGNRTPEIADRDGIVVSSDTMRQAIRTRAARAELVSALLDTGHAWERRDGLLYVIRSGEYKKFGTRKGRNRDAMIVFSENDDRWRIYEAIQHDGHFPGKSLSAIQRIFFEARIQCMREGQKYEDESGKPAVVPAQ
ncbi:MAG: hypothetical protein JXR94_00700 [Candidatus Hydrogenedentes bacterium]|nr:hypothetical protein [Candidatus Hydrogenedentota bacterium]